MFLSEAFTSSAALQSLSGGMLIGCLAAMRLYCTRNVMTCATPRLFMTAGTACFSLCFRYVFNNDDIFEAVPESVSWVRTIIAGAMIGLGARMGEGCTSGNGIQGLSAMSVASLTHVVTFMGAGVAAASLFGSSSTLSSVPASPTPITLLAAVSVGGIVTQLLRLKSADPVTKAVTDFSAGFSFASSLILAQMVHRSKVIGFLDVFNDQRGWDPSLMFVMGGALLVSAPTYYFGGLVHKSEKDFQEWTTRRVDGAHVVGGLLFGCGWGLSGWCPGPALVSCGTGCFKALAFTLPMFGIRIAYDMLPVDKNKAS